MSAGWLKNVTYKLFTKGIYNPYLYWFKQHLALNNHQGLICH